MSVYNKNGVQLAALYDTDSAISRAYDVEGGVVFNKNYDNYTISDLYTLSVNNCQGLAVYDDVLFQFRASGSSVVDTVSLFAFSTGTSIIANMTCKADHGDSATFSEEFYSPSDEFPLLYVTADTSPAIVYIDRVSRTAASLVKTLKFPLTAGYYGAGAFDWKKNVCWLIAYSKQNYQTDDSGTNKTVVSKWDLTQLTENQDGTFTPQFVSQYERDFIYVMQGLAFHSGLIWISSGYPNHAAYIYGMNPETGTIEHTIDLNTTTEVEGIQFIFDEALNDYYLLVGFQGGIYKKVVFQEAVT